MNKGQLLFFTIGVTITISTYAFFGQMMEIPGKAFKTGSNMMFPAPEHSKCDCSCN
jgi:hypothetical protein